MLYFAYGANTNRDAMARRCPDAEPIGVGVLHDAALKFKGCADVVPAKGHQVFGVLWDISRRDERALDIFEGYPTLYLKRMVTVTHNGRRVSAMMYAMTSRTTLRLPSPAYEQTLCEGYEEFDLPLLQIGHAITEAKRAESKRFKKLAAQMKLHIA